jgi:hypothetical protein
VLSRSELQPSSTALPPRCRDLFCVSPLKAGDDGGFLAPSGLKLSIADPLLATVVAIAAGAWPEALGHAELASAVSAKLGAVDSAELERALLLAHERDWVELRPGPTGCARTPGDRPRVSRLNRSELALQRPLTNRLHVPIGLGQGPAAALVAWLDGTRDRAELARLLGQERLVQNQQAGVGIVQQVLEALRTRALLESEAGAP